MKNTPEHEDALIRRLNDGGCPVLRDHGYKIDPVGLAVEPVPGLCFNRIFSLAQGGTGYYMDIVLRNESDHPIKLQGFQIKTRWGIPRISLLPTPKKSSDRWPLYCFPEPGPYYDGENVINPFLARHRQLMPGQEIEGGLVASSEESIPTGVADLSAIFITLSILDSRGNVFSGQFGLRVQRNEAVIRKYAERRARKLGRGKKVGSAIRRRSQ